MVIARCGPSHQILDQDMKRGLVDEIRASDNIGYALDMIIMCDGYMIARPNIASRNDRVWTVGQAPFLDG